MMITILITGHGYFASGMLSATQLIGGSHPRVSAVDFLEENSGDDLKANLLSVINAAHSDVLILTDIAGGSPFNTSVQLKGELPDRCIEVVSGTNIPMLISAILERGESSAAEVAEKITQIALHSVHRFRHKGETQPSYDDSESCCL